MQLDEDWHARRQDFGPRPDAPRIQGLDALATAPDADGLIQLRVRVDGLRCASCVWLVEQVLAAQDGVQDAHVSFATGHASLRYDPERTAPSVALGPIQDLGYRPAPLAQPVTADRGLLIRLGVAAFATANVMLLAATLYIGWAQPIAEQYAALFRWAALILATPVALWSAEPFHRAAWSGIKRGVLHLDLPISIAVLGMFAHGVWSTWSGGDSYLDSLVMLVTLLLAGRLLEGRGRRAVAEAALALAAEAPATARVWVDGVLHVVAAGDLSPGQVLELGAGERLAADGQVVSGQGEADLSLVTGESEPRPVGVGESLPAGALLTLGGVQVQVTQVGQDTLLAETARALAEATTAPGDRAGDVGAGWFTAATLGAAVLAWALWHDVEPVVAVLVAACPCALALARPLCHASGLGAAARRGLLLRDASVLEDLARIDTIWLDKTGTVTLGEHTVTQVDDEALRLACGLERSSLHPVARALVKEAIARGLPLPQADRVEESPGHGIQGQVEGHDVRVAALGGGRLGIWIDEVCHAVRLQDQVRPESAQAVAALQQRGIQVGLLTGDAQGPAAEVASQLGVDRVVAQATPMEKLEHVQAPGVCLVGDGLNDAAAIAHASVGLAMASGTAPSLLAADGVLVHSGIAPIVAGRVAAVHAVDAVKRSRRRALVYNATALALALSGVLDPLVAAIAMPLSSAMVLWTAHRVEARVARELS
jgi:Cu2+-exporting ATPase